MVIMLLRGTMIISWTFILLTGRYGIYYARAETPLTNVAKSNTDFSSVMYSVFTQNPGDDNQNFIFSPYSISAVMAMLKLGANGTTAIDIRNAMKYPERDETLVKGYKELLEILKGTRDFTLETVNKIYGMTGFKIKDTFTSQLKDYFNATISQLDFSNGAHAAKEINGFVEKVTRDKIKGIVSPEDFDHLTRLVLVNAIYFKGAWKYQFKKDDTKDEDFYIGGGEKIKVPLMNMETDLLYAEIPELDARVVAIPYTGDKLYMIILLPNQKDGMKEMEAKLSKEKSMLQEILNKLRLHLVNLKLPRFKLDSTIDLVGPLANLGAGSIFIKGVPDFSNIPVNNVSLVVSKALQKAFIEVNEEGSEAAAATALVISAVESTFSEPILPQVINMHVDHPFISMIVYKLDADCDDQRYRSRWTWENCGHEILFMSKVSNPQVTQSDITVKPSMTTRKGNDDSKMGSIEGDMKFVYGLSGVGKMPVAWNTRILTIISWNFMILWIHV